MKNTSTLYLHYKNREHAHTAGSGLCPVIRLGIEAAKIETKKKKKIAPSEIGMKRKFNQAVKEAPSKKCDKRFQGRTKYLNIEGFFTREI